MCLNKLLIYPNCVLCNGLKGVNKKKNNVLAIFVCGKDPLIFKDH